MCYIVKAYGASGSGAKAQRLGLGASGAGVRELSLDGLPEHSRAVCGNASNPIKSNGPGVTIAIRATTFLATHISPDGAAATGAARLPAFAATAARSATAIAAATRAFPDRRDHLSRPAVPRGQESQLVERTCCSPPPPPTLLRITSTYHPRPLLRTSTQYHQPREALGCICATRPLHALPHTCCRSH